MRNEWVYELNNGDLGRNCVNRVTQSDSRTQPSTPHVIHVTEKELHNRVYHMTMEQRTPDWFLSRIGRFTSTTLHCLINVRNAIYFNCTFSKILHSLVNVMLLLRIIYP